ncbi:MAG TPA: isoprenylcysteine carboxylmethyltransferase family protein [Candidatus Deferrimicrobiaceae bacterium]
MTRSFAWVFGVLLLQRAFEVFVSIRNRKALEPLGAKEFHPESFRNIAAMHALYFVSLAVESYPWRLPLDVRTISCLVAVALLAGLRLWCMASLHPYWNVRIVVVPGAHVKSSGPYRFLRHPNYLVVVLEFLFLPLLMRAPVTMVVFSVANLFALRQRIRFEEEALRSLTDYGKVFGG